MDLVSLRLSGVVADGGRLVPMPDIPFTLAPVCAMCTGPSLVAPCEFCGIPYCERCLPCPNCVATPGTTTEASSTPRTIAAESSADTGSTEEFVILPTLYQQLTESPDDPISLSGGYLVRLPLCVGNAWIEDEIGGRWFGTSVDDFKRLCRNVVWDYPNGLVLINLDRKRTLLFTAEDFFEPRSSALEEALQWMLRTPGVLGLGLTISGKNNCKHLGEAPPNNSEGL